jgi:exonuclease III
VKRALVALVGIAFISASAGLVSAQPTKTDDTKKSDSTTKKATHHTTIGTVKSTGAEGVVVVSKAKGKDTEKTFAIDDKTKIKKAGKDITVKDLAPGDKVTVRYMDQDGKMTAMAVSVSAGAAKQAAKDEPAKDTTKK